MAPNGARRMFFLANPELADILGDTHFDFDNFYSWDSFGSQVSGLVPAWARLGPSTWARLGPTHLGPTWARLGQWLARSS